MKTINSIVLEVFWELKPDNFSFSLVECGCLAVEVVPRVRKTLK